MLGAVARGAAVADDQRLGVVAVAVAVVRAGRRGGRQREEKEKGSEQEQAD